MIVRLSRRGEHDLRRLDPHDRARVLAALRALGAGAPNLDIRPLKGAEAWLRLRVGTYRVLHLPLEGGCLVDHIVDRGDLERAVRSLA